MLEPEAAIARIRLPLTGDSDSRWPFRTLDVPGRTTNRLARIMNRIFGFGLCAPVAHDYLVTLEVTGRLKMSVLGFDLPQ
jgi:hypothetical protein